MVGSAWKCPLQDVSNNSIVFNNMKTTADFDLCLGEQFRVRCLQEIASAMAQLYKMSFEKGGSLILDEDGYVSGVDARHYVDFNASSQTLCCVDDLGDDDRPFSFYETGPRSDVKSYFLDALDRREGLRKRTSFNDGAHTLLGHFVNWSLASCDTETSAAKAFVLGHPDFDPPNIFTDKDGRLTGIIDWDWVAAVPSPVGCLKYPNFIMKDYHPNSYKFDSNAGRPDDGCDECSSAELECY